MSPYLTTTSVCTIATVVDGVARSEPRHIRDVRGIHPMCRRFYSEVLALQCVDMPRRIHLGSTVSCRQLTDLQRAMQAIC